MTEPLMRAMIRLTVDRIREGPTADEAEAEPLRRGYRRIDWIELALERVRSQLNESTFERLVSGLALCIGMEALLVLRDIRGLDLSTAEEVSRWVARSLLCASLAQSNGTTSPSLPPEG